MLVTNEQRSKKNWKGKTSAALKERQESAGGIWAACLPGKTRGDRRDGEQGVEGE